jgi:hypothetical protein
LASELKPRQLPNEAEVVSNEVEVVARICRLITSVHDRDGHKFFSPGTKWWLASPNGKANKNEVTLESQLGIDHGTLIRIYGRKWSELNKHTILKYFLVLNFALSLYH